MGELTGSPIRKEVADSILLRQKIMGQLPINDNTPVDPSAKIKYATSRMPWVKLSSSVNVSGEKAKYFKSVTGGEASGDQLARRFVLQSINNDAYYNNTGLAGYSNSKNLGIRPQPGITSVNTKHFNRFGSLRASTVNFICWSLEQLEIMDVLYMRPGFTVLLEFGHSVYADKDGTIKNFTEGVNFFDTKNTDKSLYAAIDKLREETNYHYDAIYGFVKNFKWSFRPDGGYDCTTEIVSIGEVVESIKATLATPGVAVKETDTGTAKTRGTEAAGGAKQGGLTISENATIMHQILSIVKKDVTEILTLDKRGYYFTQVSTTIQDELKTQFPGLSKVGEYNLSCVGFKPGSVTYDQGIVNPNGPSVQPVFVKLGFLLDILNIAVLGTSEGSDVDKMYKFWTQTTVPQGPFHKFKTATNRPSVDPGICLVDAQLLSSTGANIDILSNWSDTQRKGGIYNDAKNIDEILVNIDFIISAYEPSIDTLEFIKKILAGVQSALGDINQFELQYFEESGLFAVVDRNRIEYSAKRPQIQIFGNNTFAKGVTLSSLLSPKITTMIAIGAQAGGQSGGIEGTAFSKLNRNLTDRIKPVRVAATTTTAVASNSTADTITVSPLDIMKGHLYNLYEEYEYVPEDCLEVRQLYNEFLTSKIVNQDNPSFAFAIPFELALTLDGISGIRITEAFDIPAELLPQPYRRDNTTATSQDEEGKVVSTPIVSFLVTGLDQNITSAGWTTNIRSQMFISDTGGKGYGYNLDALDLQLEDTLFSAKGPTSDGVSIIQFKGRDTTAEAIARDYVSVSSIAKSKFEAFLKDLAGSNPGIIVYVTSAPRTEAEQQVLYDSYTTKLAAWKAGGSVGQAPTVAAKPGYSLHQIGLALDLNIFDLKTKTALATANSSVAVWNQYDIGTIAKRYGMRWGGDWQGTSYDPIHVDLPIDKAWPGFDTAKFKQSYEARGASYASLEKWQFDPTGLTPGAGPAVMSPQLQSTLNAASGNTPPPQAGPVVNPNPTPTAPPTFNTTTTTGTAPLRIDPSAAAALAGYAQRNP